MFITANLRQSKVFKPTPNTWFQTGSAHIIDLNSPNSWFIDELDVARALSQISRWGGHTDTFFSVAQHSLEVSRILEDEGPLAALAGLLHDASEAYIGDMISPIKNFIRKAPGDPHWSESSFDGLEAMFHARIANTFGLDLGFESHPNVKRADEIQLCREARDLFSRNHRYSIEWIESLNRDVRGFEKLVPMPSKEAERAFWTRLKELQDRCWPVERPGYPSKTMPTTFNRASYGCPCTNTKNEPCSANCTCADQFKSGGCILCQTYATAESLPPTSTPIPASVPTPASTPTPPTPDLINHPPHYISPTGLQAIDVIEAFGLGFNLGNVAKYVLRSSAKGNMLQDLQKARWYLDREIESLKDDNTP